MRTSSLILASALLVSSHAQLVFPFISYSPLSPGDADRNQHQRPIMDSANAPGIQLPPSKDEPPPPRGDVILSDVLNTQRTINIFAAFARTIDSVSTRLDSASQNTTVLAPLNSVLSSLPRKPWEDPRDYGALGADAYEGKDGEDRAQRNMRRFVEAHVVPVSPWAPDERVQNSLGLPVWWETRDDGKAYIMPGSVEVERVVSMVGNGEVWALKGVLNYAA